MTKRKGEIGGNTVWVWFIFCSLMLECSMFSGFATFSSVCLQTLFPTEVSLLGPLPLFTCPKLSGAKQVPTLLVNPVETPCVWVLLGMCTHPRSLCRVPHRCVTSFWIYWPTVPVEQTLFSQLCLSSSLLPNPKLLFIASPVFWGDTESLLSTLYHNFAMSNWHF